MASYQLTSLAVKDLSNIWNYTFDTWSEEQADIYFLELISGFDLIADQQTIGLKYPSIRADLLGLQVNRHIIFYRIITKDQVEITRILHDRMDLKSRID
ncbi:MAG: type II toxin-antitoxin system RelE/ParE family toxin [Balneolaceae bacterium]|nr:type II toxin-antitoxin system RelE/ParE family toxin [Balneolaceae bacterium]